MQFLLVALFPCGILWITMRHGLQVLNTIESHARIEFWMTSVVRLVWAQLVVVCFTLASK